MSELTGADFKSATADDNKKTLKDLEYGDKTENHGK